MTALLKYIDLRVWNWLFFRISLILLQFQEVLKEIFGNNWWIKKELPERTIGDFKSIMYSSLIATHQTCLLVEIQIDNIQIMFLLSNIVLRNLIWMLLLQLISNFPITLKRQYAKRQEWLGSSTVHFMYLLYILYAYCIYLLWDQFWTMLVLSGNLTFLRALEH